MSSRSRIGINTGDIRSSGTQPQLQRLWQPAGPLSLTPPLQRGAGRARASGNRFQRLLSFLEIPIRNWDCGICRHRQGRDAPSRRQPRFANLSTGLDDAQEAWPPRIKSSWTRMLRWTISLIASRLRNMLTGSFQRFRGRDSAFRGQGRRRCGRHRYPQSGRFCRQRNPGMVTRRLSRQERDRTALTAP